MNYQDFNRGFNTQSVVINLVIINVLMFLATLVVGAELKFKLGLHMPGSEHFRPWQLFTHFFMHANFWHLAFNMYALWLFGQNLEYVWGAKRFLIYYLVCAFGAAGLYLLTRYLELPDDPALAQAILNNPSGFAVGASGAVFGLLLGFGMLFPNTQLFLLFFPFPIKAKYFVIGYGLIELFGGLRNSPTDQVAHYAHLGGMLFGFIMIQFWKKDRNNFY